MARVSVIMPVRDARPFIGEAIRSVLAQTHRDLDLLVMDDGSTDGSGDVARAAGDPRVRVYAQERSGLSAALNRLLALATGEIVARADADDVCLARRLEAQLAYLESHHAVGAVGCFCDTIDASGGVSRAARPPASPGECARGLRHAPTIWHPAAMYRRSVVLEAGGYDEGFSHAQDYDLWARLARRTLIANVPEVLLCYRVHAAAASSTGRAGQLEAHRRIRARIWSDAPAEPFEPARWMAELREALRTEREAVAAGTDALGGTARALAVRRVKEANLAQGARRPDIGLRCLSELAALRRSFRPAWALARAAGFGAAWASLRTLGARRFARAGRLDPTFEW